MQPYPPTHVHTQRNCEWLESKSFCDLLQQSLGQIPAQAIKYNQDTENTQDTPEQRVNWSQDPSAQKWGRGRKSKD